MLATAVVLEAPSCPAASASQLEATCKRSLVCHLFSRLKCAKKLRSPARHTATSFFTIVKQTGTKNVTINLLTISGGSCGGFGATLGCAPAPPPAVDSRSPFASPNLNRHTINANHSQQTIGAWSAGTFVSTCGTLWLWRSVGRICKARNEN